MLGLPSTAKRWRWTSVAQLLGEDRPFLDVGLGQDEHEFLAAVPADHVGRAQVRGDRLGDAPQHDVADGVAVRVVDRLEMVDVDERHRQRPARSAPARSTSANSAASSDWRLATPVSRSIVARSCVSARAAGDVVDRAGETALEAAAARAATSTRVVAGGDAFGGLDQAAETVPAMGSLRGRA